MEIDLGDGYRSLFIFECKNWQRRVNKNEVIVFSEKIRALQAQKGFFVARSFTRDARAQAASDPRVQLLHIKEDPLPFALKIGVIVKERIATNVSLHARGWPRNSPLERWSFKGLETQMDQESVDFEDYVRRWSSETAKRLERDIPSGLPVGQSKCFSSTVERTFGPGELIMNGMGIETITLDVNLWVRLVRPTIVSRFDVLSRGRIHSFAPVPVGGGLKVKINVVKR